MRCDICRCIGIAMNRIFLHIGLEKTGTTALQVFLRDNEERLRDAGFTYLCDNARSYFDTTAHFPLAACFSRECPDFVAAEKFRSADEVLGELGADIRASQQDVILSCEQLSSRLISSDEVRRLRDAMAGRPVTVVCYIRRQDDLALATYTTSVRHGRRTPFSVGEVHPVDRRYDFLAILDLWSSVFSRESIIVRRFDRNHLAGADICRDFAGLLGIAVGESFSFPGDLNVSLDSKQVEMLRMTNQFLSTFDEGRQLYDAAQLVRRHLLKALPTGSPIRGLLTSEDRRMIMARFDVMNSVLEQRFFRPGDLHDWQSSQIPGGIPEARPARPTCEDFAEALARVGEECLAALETPSSNVDEVGSSAALETPSNNVDDVGSPAATPSGIISRLFRLR